MSDLSDYDIDQIRKLLEEDDKIASAELKLAGERDRKDCFEFRSAKRNASCRACHEYVTRGDKTIWASGYRESLIICLPCASALGRLLRTSIL